MFRTNKHIAIVLALAAIIVTAVIVGVTTASATSSPPPGVKIAPTTVSSVTLPNGVTVTHSISQFHAGSLMGQLNIQDPKLLAELLKLHPELPGVVLSPSTAGGPDVARQAPSGTAGWHDDVTYSFWGVTEYTWRHVIVFSYANYKVQHVLENFGYPPSGPCCGWSYQGEDYSATHPNVPPAISPVRMNAQGRFQWCAGPICITTAHPGSSLQGNGEGHAFLVRWWIN